MRFLFTANPGLGHFLPMVPLARGLRERGHTVRFACARRMCGVMEGLGFDVVPAGLDWQESAAVETFPRLASLPLASQSFYFLRDIFAGEAAVAMVPDLVGVAGEWPPDLLVHNDFDFAACVAAELLSVPHATLGVSLYLPPALLKHHAGRHLRRLRARFGLPDDPDLGMLYRHLYLSCAPPSLQPPGVPLPATVQPMRPSSFDRLPGAMAPEWLDRLPAQPTVYATLGTVFNRTPGVFPAILEALGDLPINLVLTIGEDQRRESFGPQPGNVFIEHFVPNSILIPRSDLLLTNGSFSTILAALTHRVPLVLVPLSSDEPPNALRCREAGVAQVLEHPRAAPWFRYLRAGGLPRFSAGSLREAVRRSLREPPREALQRLHDELNAMPPLDRALDLLEATARGAAAPASVPRTGAEPARWSAALGAGRPEHP